jgi:hypothetical protein
MEYIASHNQTQKHQPWLEHMNESNMFIDMWIPMGFFLVPYVVKDRSCR